ncbi:MAG TPA: YCF48-related protein, partial [Chryseolinea sp.]|nr:YCF48-related protein [Chryseolinea sp.]
EAGTISVDDGPGAAKSFASVAGDYLYYLSNTALKRTDGTTITTIQFPEAGTTSFHSMHAVGDDLYVIRRTTDDEYKMWVYDKGENWILLKSFKPLYSGSRTGIHNVTPVGGKVFFTFRKSDNMDSNADELWVSDGSVDGTIRLREFTFRSTDGYGYADHFVTDGNYLFFKGGTSSANSLWRSDGTVAGTIKVHDAKILRSFAHIHDLNLPVVSGGKLWFCGGLENEGELWRSDGTTEGTALWADLHPNQSSFPHLLTDAEGSVFFVTHDSNTGLKILWNNSPAPDINVGWDYNTTVFENGGSLSLYGREDCVKQTIIINNTGHKELSFSRIQVTGTEFFLKGALPEYLDPGESINIDVFYNPVPGGPKQAQLSIFSNDEDEPIFTLNVYRNQYPPEKELCSLPDTGLTKILYASRKSEYIILLSNNQISSHLTAPSVVGNLTVPAFAEVPLFELVVGKGDEDNDKFFIEGSLLKAKLSFKQAVKNVYTVRVKATSGALTREDAFSIDVSDSPTPPLPITCTPEFESLSYLFTDLEFNSLGELFALTLEGRILRSQDEGISWEFIDTGNWGYLRRVFFKNNTGYILGDYVFLKSVDHGANWFEVQLPTPSTQYFDSPRTGYFFTESEGFLTGGDGEIIYTTDGGQHWEQKISSGYGSFNHPWFFDNKIGIAIQDGRNIVRTTDGGETWATLSVPSTSWSPLFTSLSFLNNNVGFLTTFQEAFKTSDGGLTWQVIPGVSGSSIEGIEFFDATNGFIYGGNAALLFQTKDGGLTWDRVFENYGLGHIRSVERSQTGKIFLAHSDDSGTTRALNVSDDDGATWRVLQELSDDDFRRIDFATEDVGYLFNTSAAFKTVDRGITWNRLDWDRPIYSAYFFNETDALLSDRFVIYKTTDGGATMDEVLVTSEDPDNYLPVGALYGVDKNVIFSCSAYALYRSVNGGNDWELMNDQSFANWQVQFLSATLGYRMESGGGVQKTTDGGATWVDVYIRQPDASDYYRAIFFINEYVGYKGGKQISKTTDGGITWSTIVRSFEVEIVGLHFMDALHGYTWGGTKIIYETRDGGLTWTAISFRNNNSDEMFSVQFKHGNIYMAGKKGFVGQISNPGMKPLQPGYLVGKDIVCAGDIELYNLPFNYSGTYQWNISDGTLSATGSSATVHFPAAGDYVFTVKNFNECGISETRTHTVKAVALPLPEISGADFIESAERAALYEIENAEEELVYTWIAVGSEGFESEEQTRIAVNWDADAESTGVFVVATDTLHGCRTRGELPVTVEILLGTDDEVSSYIQVHPNPTSGDVFIQSQVPNKLYLKVTDILGRDYDQWELQPFQETSMSLRSLPAGLYILEMHDGADKKKIIKRIIKK